MAQGEPGTGSGDADIRDHSEVARWQKFDEGGLNDLREEGESRTALILRHTLAHPHSHTNIVGTTSPEHLAENVDAIARGPLSPDVYAAKPNGG